MQMWWPLTSTKSQVSISEVIDDYQLNPYQVTYERSHGN